jgi:hypothetical protein
MKKIIYVSILVLFTMNISYGQKISADKVSAAVSKAFNEKFPKATDVSWEMENKSEYEADFKLNNEKFSASFDLNGKWLETEIEIEVAKLPQVVSQSLVKTYPGFTIKEAEKIETADKGTIYEVKINKDKETFEIQLSSKGDILNKKVEKDEKD